MIRYALRCTNAHGFESWFRDSGAFDEQQAAGLVECPVCGTHGVDKALMAPAVVTDRAKGRGAPPPDATPATESQPTVPVVLDDEATRVRAMMRQMRDHLVAHSRNVGPAFAEEARRIHEGAVEKTAIHGEASADDVRALLEDGIQVMPLPVFPDDRN